jgi:drug/metabolite transporter, DME family
LTEPTTGAGAGAIVVAHLALLTVAFAYTVFSHGLTVVLAATAVTLTLVEPMTAGMLGVIVLGESLSPIALAGVALVLAGLFSSRCRMEVQVDRHP